jgi:hypothetical protein
MSFALNFLTFRPDWRLEADPDHPIVIVLFYAGYAGADKLASYLEQELLS